MRLLLTRVAAELGLVAFVVSQQTGRAAETRSVRQRSLRPEEPSDGGPSSPQTQSDATPRCVAAAGRESIPVGEWMSRRNA
jgi:hypothetical protein